MFRSISIKINCMWYYTRCIELNTVWKNTHCVYNYTRSVRLHAECKITHCVRKLHTVCKITHCVSNYTLCEILHWLSKNSSHLKFFTLTPVVAVVTIIRHGLSLNYGKYQPPYSSSSFPRRSSSSCFRGWHFYERVVPARSKSKRGPARLGGKAVRPKIFSHISVFSVFYLVVSTRRCTSNTSRSAPTSLGH